MLMDANPEEEKPNDEGIFEKIGNFISRGRQREANLEENKPIENKSSGEGVLSKVENFLTLGYGRKEDLRELDKALRERYFSEMMGLRHRWEQLYLEILENGPKTIGKECKKVIQTIDRLSFAINRADYGYAPLFDRVDEIKEPTLTRVLEYDKTLINNIDQLGKDINAVEVSVGQTDWAQLRTDLKALKKNLSMFDEAWRMREQSMTGKR